MTLARYDKKRRLERAGFVFLSGWVRNEDAPPIRRAFQRGEEQAAETLDKSHDPVDNSHNRRRWLA
jgi:hypothetical protein